MSLTSARSVAITAYEGVSLLDLGGSLEAFRNCKVKLPKRQKPHGYQEPDYPYKMVPEKF